MFIDFSKAFDTLSHSNLLDILEKNGVRGNCLNWFKNYLNLRTYKVRISNCLSNETPLNENGVPQGSKLGPILYLLYANNMINILKNSTAFAYADDTAIIVSNKKIEDANRIMQEELDIVTKWSHDNGLVINASKTKMMHIKPPHLSNYEIQIKFHSYQCLHNQIPDTSDSCSTVIEVVKTYKYLGVLVDENFKWLSHTQELRKKLRKTAYNLFHLSNCATYNVLKQAYFALAESYLRHGITAWGSSTYCRSLQQTQNQILRILHKNQSHKQNLQYSTICDNNTTNTFSNYNTSNNSTPHNSSVVEHSYNENNNTYANVNISNNTNLENDGTTNNNLITSNGNIISNRNANISHTHTNTRLRNTTNNSNSTQTNINSNVNTTSLAAKLRVLNVRNIYHSTIINEFYNDRRYLTPINHTYNTRSRSEGRYTVERFQNNYGKNSLDVVLPTLLNKLPTNLLNVQNEYRRKKLLKLHFLNSQ